MPMSQLADCAHRQPLLNARPHKHAVLLCAGIFGALYCLADVQTEFSEVAKQLKEVAELLGQGLNRQLSGPLLHEYLVSRYTSTGSGPVFLRGGQTGVVLQLETQQ